MADELIHSTLTERGQTTVPASVRKALGLRPRQRIRYEITAHGVVMQAETESVLDLAGALRSGIPAASKAEERKSARASRLRRSH